MEFFLGQPGSVGGAVWINAHNMKMGKYISDAIVSAIIFDSDNKIRNVPKSYFKFNYDSSIIQKTNDIVLSVLFELSNSDKVKLWQVAKEALLYRGITQPRGVYSSGCIFRNISQRDAVRIATPDYTRSAGYLLENAGMKNVSVGKARFSDLHANFIIHHGDANADEVSKLIALAKLKVKSKFNVDLGS